MPKRALGVAQTIPVPGDVRANVTQHLGLAARAAKANAAVLVFPELSLTGYELDRAAELAFTLDDPRLHPLLDAAVRHQMTLVVGAPAHLSGRLYNAALLLGPSGDVRVYTKRHLGAFPPEATKDLCVAGGQLPPAEPTVFSVGALDPQVVNGRQRVGLAVCADANRPTHAAHAAERGASVYMAASFVIPSEFDAYSTQLAEHARRHRMTVAFANYGGPSGGLASAGQSTIWAPNGEVVSKLGPAGAGILLAAEAPTGLQAIPASSP